LHEESADGYIEMKRYIFDVETDGLLPDLTTVHSLVLYNLDTHDLLSFDSDPARSDDNSAVHSSCAAFSTKAKKRFLKGGSIELGLAELGTADMVAGHHVIGFDLPAIKKVYPRFKLKEGCEVRDTLLMSKLMFPAIKDRDLRIWAREKGKRERGNIEGCFPGQLIGRHGLEAWGHRLGFHKGDYSKEMKAKGLDPWANWSRAMQDYCENDVLLNVNLWERMEKKQWSDLSLWIEHEFYQLIELQVNHGFHFNETAAVELYGTVCKARNEIEMQLQEVFPPWMVKAGPKKVPMRTANYKDKLRADVIKDVPYTPVVMQEFNPGSRMQIAKRLGKKYGWKPEEFTPDGRAKIDEDILDALPYPEAKLLARYLMLEKRAGQIGEGKQAWLKKVKNGRIHGRVDTAGAVTRRCTHNNPNVAQVPSIHNAKGPVPFGKECRALFIAPPGYLLVGVDASGLELRCLAHYMGKYDGGAYGQVILNGDVHTSNQNAATLDTRDQAKRFIYAFLYGAGDGKIGEIVGKGPKEGKRLKTVFLNGTPALKRLRKRIDMTVEKNSGKMKAVDGGWLHVRHKHTGLNTLLQSAGAIAMKLAAVLLWHDLSTSGWVHGDHYAFVANIHDEIQAIVREDLVAEYEEKSVDAIRRAGDMLGFRCPLDGEAKHGQSWADTH